MKKISIYLVILLTLYACKTTSYTSDRHNNNAPLSKIDKIIKYSKTFEGVKYKYGGTDRRGLDCSGLIYLSFKKENIALPRVSYIIAKEGYKIPVKKVKKGDLLFFKTNKNKNRINHLGLVVNTKNGDIKFRHATTSKGVITSSLSNTYWKSAFTEARRLF